MTLIPLDQLPRLCPFCVTQTIIGHGRRRKQAHDQHRDWIWVRRGLCPRCRKTFTILPIWSPPYGHYSCCCRQQAWESNCEGAGGWEQSTPQIKDPNRLPDPATQRRWALRRVLSLCCGLKAFGICWPRWQTFLCAPTILAWDWMAVGRNLLVEADSS